MSSEEEATPPGEEMGEEEILKLLGMKKDIDFLRALTMLRKGKDSFSDAIALFLLIEYIRRQKDEEWSQLLRDREEKLKKELLSFRHEIKPVLEKTLNVIDSLSSMIGTTLSPQRQKMKVEVVE